MIVGTLEAKKNKDNGKEYFDLSMNIPFHKEQKFYVVANDKKTSENSPDYKMFHAGNVAGVIWKKKTSDGKNYHSGSVFCLGMPQNRLQFAIFQADDEKKKNEDGSRVYFVVIGEGEKKDSDAMSQAPKDEDF